MLIMVFQNLNSFFSFVLLIMDCLNKFKLAFKLYENHEYSIFQYKLIYCFFQALTFTFIMYRIFNLGLLPLNPSDWVSLIENTIQESKVFAILKN